MSNIPSEEMCAQCGWRKRDHSNGYCYSHSDEDSDHFYHDRTFVSIESVRDKEVTRAFNGMLIIQPKK